jgi:hypothetical protein
VRREARDGFILEEDLAAGRMKNSGQEVKEGGFPGSVGSDDIENFPSRTGPGSFRRLSDDLT